MADIRIILVDDHSMIREGLRSFLEEDEITVVAEAKNGIDALEKLEQIEVDVVVSDIMMPEMDGIELAKQIREKYPNLHILALTMMNESFVGPLTTIGLVLKGCHSWLDIAIYHYLLYCTYNCIAGVPSGSIRQTT